MNTNAEKKNHYLQGSASIKPRTGLQEVFELFLKNPDGEVAMLRLNVYPKTAKGAKDTRPLSRETPKEKTPEKPSEKPSEEPSPGLNNIGSTGYPLFHTSTFGPLSAVSTFQTARLGSPFSIRFFRDLQDMHSFTPLQSQGFIKILSKSDYLFAQIFTSNSPFLSNMINTS